MNATTQNQRYVLQELEKEALMSVQDEETFAREARCIDLSNFAERKNDIAEQLQEAAVEIGFFQVSRHGIPLADIRQAFSMIEAFLDLPDEMKHQYPLAGNAGWESKAQVRPSTRMPDQKESYQIIRPLMVGRWSSDRELPASKQAMLRFELQCWQLGVKILSCFALKLGFPESFFTTAHDPQRSAYQSTLRMLHYYTTEQSQQGMWWVGAHTDFDYLVLLFQRPGQGGLQVCPGKDRESQQWTSIEPCEGVITCNIGDMSMCWSDDQLPFNSHRVRNPLLHEYQGPRYSLAFFCQANKDVEVLGPQGRYPPISAEDYLQQQTQTNLVRGQTYRRGSLLFRGGTTTHHDHLFPAEYSSEMVGQGLISN